MLKPSKKPHVLRLIRCAAITFDMSTGAVNAYAQKATSAAPITATMIAYD